MGTHDSLDYQRVERAIRFIEEHATEQPSLADVAREVALSPFHFQRLFVRWAGVSPKRFVQFLTLEHAKELLRDSASVLDTTLEVGLSSTARLHDLFVAVEAVTPGEYKQRGVGVELRYGVHPSPFGDALVAASARGLCHLSFPGADETTKLLAELAREWPRAKLVEDRRASAELAERVFAGGAPHERSGPLRIYLQGTRFQLKVWQALLRVPAGSAVSYSELAARVGNRRASRAVASAVAANPISFVIPCHRVLRKSGQLGGYRWGTARKRAMLAWEATRPR